MKAISLWQPWATAIAVGVKKVETRGWYTPYRGPLAIHAAKWQARRNTTIERLLPSHSHWGVWRAEVWGRYGTAGIMPKISVYGATKFAAIRKAIRAEARGKR